MKKQYGVAMNTYGHIVPGAVRLSRVVKLDRDASLRLQWMDYYRRCQNGRLTCRHFGIPPKTFYKWLKRYNEHGVTGLKAGSRRPRAVRQSALPQATIDAVIRWRTKYPEFSKYKIATLLARENGIELSPSTIGRIFNRYHLFSPSPLKPKKHRHRASLAKQRLHPYYRSRLPGELVEADMKHVPFFGRTRYFFVGIDCVTKRLAVVVGTTSSSRQASQLLDSITTSFPYPVTQLRVDNGSENLKHFHARATELGITVNYTRYRRPKDKPFVERVIGTIEREFIQRGKLAIDLNDQRQLIDEWVDHYNTFRPHQALNYLTPDAFERTLQLTTKALPM